MNHASRHLLLAVTFLFIFAATAFTDSLGKIISDTTTSSGRVVIAEKDGVRKTAHIPLTMANMITDEQILHDLFDTNVNIPRQTSRALNQHLTFYGLVLDDQTNIVVGATITGNVLVEDGQNPGHNVPLQTTSGSDGRFQFDVDDGQLIMINVNNGANYISPPPRWFQYGPVGNRPIYYPDVNNPTIFVLTKKQSTDSIVEVSHWFYAPNSGKPVHVDLSSGKTVKDGGDLIVSIYCPEPYTELKRFPWKLSVQVIGGGLIPVDVNQSLRYMFKAPSEGYQSGFDVEYGPSIEPWRVQYEGVYYLTSRNGQFFGKMSFRMNTRWDKLGVPFNIHSFVNTNGSRNLQTISQ